MKSILFVCLLAPLLASSQTRITVHTGANFPSIEFLSHTINFRTDLRDDWYPGVNLGVGLQFPILDWLEISPQFEYSHYFYERFYIGTYAQLRSFLSASGQPSHAYRFMIEGRLYDRASSAGSVYFSTGLAYVLEKLGTITQTWSDYQEPLMYQPPGRHFFAHALGLGGLIRLSDALFLELSLKAYTNYDDPWDLSTNLGVSFILPK
jgi:hypothetical protein